MNLRTLASIIGTRLGFNRMLNGESGHDIDKECGYPAVIETHHYEKFFTRGDIAQRVVSLFPTESWEDDPEVYENESDTETEFEKAWKLLLDTFYPFSVLQRIDIMSGVGRYGVLLLGFGDGQTLATPVSGVSVDGKPSTTNTAKNELIYLRPFDETFVTISELETDVSNPRFGKPKIYRVSFATDKGQVAGQSNENVLDVHWSRIIHVADNRYNSEVYGQPRMKLVYNRLLDLRKLAGGSAEMFWKGGFPGLSIEAMPQVAGEEIEFDEKSIAEQVEKYQAGLQRYLGITGATAKSLAPNVADPTAAITAQLKLIATAMAVPWRILIGSEAAQLASEQDSRAWSRRINKRRLSYINPDLLRPFINRLIDAGALPRPKAYIIDWPGLNESEGKEKAEIAQLQSTAMASYVSSGCDVLMPPFQYLTLVLGFTDEEANAAIDEAEDNLLLEKGDSNSAETGDSNSAELGDSNA